MISSFSAAGRARRVDPLIDSHRRITGPKSGVPVYAELEYLTGRPLVRAA
jgi:hypothetical protein